MRGVFDEDRFELMNVDKVHVADHRFGHDRRGDLDVWTTRGATGTAFAHRISVDGTAGPVSQGVYSRACYFLRERQTGHYFFLESAERGFTLHGDDFFGAEAYLTDEAGKVEAWLTRERS